MRAQGLEGLVAKRLDSVYEPGQRSGTWRKVRVNRSQEFVIGGYTVGGRHLGALIFGYYEGDRLIYVARTRSGFTPALREQLHNRFRGLLVRWERRADNYLAMVQLVCGLIAFQQAGGF